MNFRLSRLLLPAVLLMLNSCVIVEPDVATNNESSHSLAATPGFGSVIIRANGRVVRTIHTARPNVEETRWHKGQSQIVVKSRGNHGPATVELFDSHSGVRLGKVMAYEISQGGPAWARGMAE